MGIFPYRTGNAEIDTDKKLEYEKVQRLQALIQEVNTQGKVRRPKNAQEVRFPPRLHVFSAALKRRCLSQLRAVAEIQNLSCSDGSVFSKVDLGIVKYNFEVGANSEK